jgi:hypothetical protein
MITGMFGTAVPLGNIVPTSNDRKWIIGRPAMDGSTSTQ